MLLLSGVCHAPFCGGQEARIRLLAPLQLSLQAENEALKARGRELAAENEALASTQGFESVLAAATQVRVTPVPTHTNCLQVRVTHPVPARAH